MPNNIGGSRSPTPTHQDYSQQSEATHFARTSQSTTHAANSSATNDDWVKPGDWDERAEQGRMRAMAWIGRQSGITPMLVMHGEATATSSVRNPRENTLDVSYPPQVQALLNDLKQHGDIKPSAEDMEAAENGVEHTDRRLPSVTVEQIASHFRARMPFAAPDSIRTLAEMAHNRREVRRESEFESTRHSPFYDIAVQRLDNLGVKLVGTDPSKENEYKENCQELQQALRDQSLLGHINDKTYQAYSGRLGEIIKEMPFMIEMAAYRQQILSERLHELMGLGAIQPSHEALEEAERDIQRYIGQIPEEEREQEIENFRNGPYLDIAHDRLDGLSNPPVGKEYGDQHDYIQACNDLKIGLKQKLDEGVIDPKTHHAYAEALAIKTEDILMAIDSQRG